MKKWVLVRFVIQEDRAPETAVSRVRIQDLNYPKEHQDSLFARKKKKIVPVNPEGDSRQTV